MTQLKIFLCLLLSLVSSQQQDFGPIPAQRIWEAQRGQPQPQSRLYSDVVGSRNQQFYTGGTTQVGQVPIRDPQPRRQIVRNIEREPQNFGTQDRRTQQPRVEPQMYNTQGVQRPQEPNYQVPQNFENAPRPQQFVPVPEIITRAGASTTPPQIGTKFGVPFDEALDAIFAIAVRLEALLSDTNLKNSRNFMVSPLSMAVAVGELMLGARGPFEEQLHDLLLMTPSNHSQTSVRHHKEEGVTHVSLHQQLGDLLQILENRSDQSYKLTTASILFLQHDIKIKDSYKYYVNKYYGTKVHPLDFQRDPYGSQQVINRWVRESTNNLIKELIGGPPSPNTAAILANAVYFKADWEVPFASEINKRGVFRISQTENMTVTYMIGEFDNYKYVENKNLGCRMVVIPYLNDEVSFHIIMPNPDPQNPGSEYQINEFVRKLRNKDVLSMIQATRVRKVTMVLPKMSLSNTVSMIEPLKRYQAYKNMNRNSFTNLVDIEDKVRNFQNQTVTPTGDMDLSNMSEDPRFKINNIYQQMTLTVNEKGTEAAAISAGIVDYIMDSVVFRVDRPFLFFIRHEETGAVLFWGTIENPVESRNF